MNSAPPQTLARCLVVSFSGVALFMATASTVSAQAIPDLFTKVETLTLNDGTPAVGSVSIGGDTAVVGGVYVFEREPGGDHWALSATLVGGGGTVATDGQTIVVRAEGAVHVFQRVPGTHAWQEAARLTGDQNPGTFGSSVAASGTTVVVGAPGPRNLPGAQEGPGVVYVFERDGGGPDQWGEVARLVGPPPPPGPRSGDSFGSAVALDGDTLVVEHTTLFGGVTGGPTVRVFSRPHRDSKVWTQVATFPVLSSPAEVGGGPVDISGNRILASIVAGDGAAVLFEQGRSSDEWYRVAGFYPAGSRPRISGDSLVTTPAGNPAEVHVYARNQDGADQWGEVARGLNPLPSPLPPFPAFKISAISGDTVLAGGFLSETGGPPENWTYTEVEVYVADTDRDGLRDGRDPCPRDPLNNIAGRCQRASAAHPVLDELIAQGEVTSETSGRRQIITATFTNTSDTTVQNPFFEVTELTGRNVLLNGDAGRGRIGATLSPDVGDGILSPGESMTVTFEIRLRTRNPFQFFVTLHGDPVPSS